MTINTPISEALELVHRFDHALQVYQLECRVSHAYAGLALPYPDTVPDFGLISLFHHICHRKVEGSLWSMFQTT